MVKSTLSLPATAIIVLTLLTSGGCSDLQSRIDNADHIARQAGLTPKVVDGGAFHLLSYARLTDPEASVHIYIEGDGFAWVTRNQRSADPTPYNPVALKLAGRDSSANVIYLARPCQYLGAGTEPRCTQEIWSDARFSDEVVAATNRVIDQLVDKHRKIELIGYSGGAAVALLVAARRHDVVSLRTVAGNIDHESFTQHHHVTPLAGSLNPRDVARQLATIPQRHYIGGNDEVITKEMDTAYLQAMGDTHCAQLIVINKVTHSAGWEERWPELLRQEPVCRAE